MEFSYDSEIDYKTESKFLRIWPDVPEQSLSFQRVSETQKFTPRFSEWSGIPLRIVDGSVYCSILDEEMDDTSTVKLRSNYSGTSTLSMEVDFYNEDIAGGEGQGGYRWRVEYPVGVMENSSSVEVAKPEYVGRVLEQPSKVITSADSTGTTIKLFAAIAVFAVAAAVIAVSLLGKRKKKA